MRKRTILIVDDDMERVFTGERRFAAPYDAKILLIPLEELLFDPEQK